MSNFLAECFSREIGGNKKWKESTIRLSRRMFRQILISKERTFKKIPSVILSNGQVIYDDGKLFLSHKGTNAVDCYHLRDGSQSEDLSKVLRCRFSIPLKPTWKDQVTNLPTLLPD